MIYDMMIMISCDMMWYMMIWYDIWCDMICDMMWWYDMIWYDIWCDMICDMMWYMMIWYDVIWYHVIWCDMIWWYGMIWCDIWYDVIWCDIWYDVIWYMIYILTEIGLTPGGSTYSLSIYLSGLVTAVAVFRNPNTIPFCLATDLLNVLFSWLLVHLPSTRGGPKLALLPGSLILSFQGLEEENLDQKSPGPPGWGLMQRASSSLITKKQKMLKNQTRIHYTTRIHKRNIKNT